jgi:hypothetical protein|tara:strand:- start:207 stop:944 length:738 start_codon:yes stop_codon:yes gene_type:complete
MAFKMKKKLTVDGYKSIPDPPIEGVQQLKDWVNARQATGGFDDQLGDGQKEKGFENLDKVQKVSKRKFGEVFGSSQSYSTKGQYSVDDDIYFADNDDTNNHELAHVFDIGTTGAPQEINDRFLNEDDIFSSISKKITSIPIKDYEPNFVSKLFGQEKESFRLDQYQLNANEVYAELMKFRMKHQIDPNRVFTKQDVFGLREKLKEEGGYGSDRNIEEHYTDENLLRLFNEVVDVSKNNTTNNRLA